MVKNIIRLAVVLLILHAAFRFGTAYLHYEEFRDAVEETARFSKDKDDAAVVDRVMELAEKYEIPLERDFVQVAREDGRTRIDASYAQMIDWLPGYRKPWQFHISEGGRGAGR